MIRPKKIRALKEAVQKIDMRVELYLRERSKDIINNKKLREYKEHDLRSVDSLLLSKACIPSMLEEWYDFKLAPKYMFGSITATQRQAMLNILANLNVCCKYGFVLAVDSRKASASEKKAVQLLHAFGLIIKQNGSEKSGMVTRIASARELQKAFNLFCQEIPVHKHTVKVFKGRDAVLTSDKTVIALRDDNKKYKKIQAKDKRDSATKAKYSKLEQDILSVNEFNNQAEIVAEKAGTFIYVNTDMRAIYKNSLGCGGRLYTSGFNGLHALTKEERKSITIDGERCSESDYSGFHITRIYQDEGETVEGDAYKPAKVFESICNHKDTKGLNKTKYTQLTKSQKTLLRSVIKVSCNILINASDEVNAKQAMRMEIDKQGLRRIYNILPKEGSLNILLDAIKEAHSTIASSFCTGKGLWIHEQDARIFLNTALRLQEYGIVALNMHDAIIYKTEHKDIVVRVMEEVYEEITGYKPSIDTEDNPVVPAMREVVSQEMQEEECEEETLSAVEQIILEAEEEDKATHVVVEQDTIKVFCTEYKDIVDSLMHVELPTVKMIA